MSLDPKSVHPTSHHTSGQQSLTHAGDEQNSGSTTGPNRSTDSNHSTGPKQVSEMPAWRKQFPIDTVEEGANSRRQFIGGLAVAGGTMACGQLALQAVDDPRGARSDGSPRVFAPLVLDKKLTDLAVGEAFGFHYPHEKSPCLLIRTAEDRFVALTQKCTHLACPVIPDLKKSELHCPCHHGSFDLDGNPTAGPPRSPLDRVCVDVSEDGTLTATGLV